MRIQRLSALPLQLARPVPACAPPTSPTVDEVVRTPASTATAVAAPAWDPEGLKESLSREIHDLFAFVSKLPPAVTIFGTSRHLEDGSHTQELCAWAGRQLARLGVPVKTGGGDGVMAEVLKAYVEERDRLHGDFQLSDPSLSPVPTELRTQAINIKLPWEQKLNPYCELSHEVGAPLGLLHRELALYVKSRGLAVLSGGLGSVKELFDIWAMRLQGRHHDPIAVDALYWGGILGAVHRSAVEERKLITDEEWGAVVMTQDRSEALNLSMADADPHELDGLAERLGQQMREGIDRLAQTEGPAVVVVGSERLDRADPTCTVTTEVARELASEGIGLRIGSCGAVAEAVVAGAGSHAQAFVLKEEMERAASPAVDSVYAVDDSTTKQLLLGLRAKAILALPGDIRSLSDLLSILVLAYVNAIPKMPIVLVGKSYWEPIVEELRKTMIAADFPTASAGILDRVTVTDDPGRALDAIHGPFKS